MPRDWIETLTPLLSQGWILTPDGKVTPGRDSSIAINLPWIYSNVQFDCTRWNQIYHNIVAKQTRVHSHCHNCVKIVAKPKNLRQLVRIEKIQKEGLFPCKCGIDRRENTSALYGAYWYNRGMDEAKFRYPLIRKAFDENKMKKLPLIIKIGCTEFEQAMGPTDQWESPTPEQLQDEADMEKALSYTDIPPTNIPDIEREHTHHIWVRWAYQHGDKTYLDFTGGVPLYPELVTYDPGDEDAKT